MALGDAARDSDRRYVGGPQALLSPIGRGGGWGRIGRVDLRDPVRALLDAVLAGHSEKQLTSKLAAAAEALTAQSDETGSKLSGRGSARNSSAVASP